jgi:glycosyltransferase involved in cell wall biosynthesis
MAISTHDRPLISVVVPAHNEERFLDQALASLAGQSFRAFEIIAVDNGSTDRTSAILAGWANREPRLRTVRLDRPSLHESLRQGVALARADVIARLDSDDIAEPKRLERQYRFLLAHPQLGLLGSAATLIDARDRCIGRSVPSLDDAAIRRLLPNECPFIHSSVMMRRQAYERVGGYRSGLNLAEDFDLWLRMSPSTRMANLPDRLIRYRIHNGSLSARKLPQLVLTALCVSAAHVAREAGLAEPFADGRPALRRALPLLGYSRTEVQRRIYRGYFERWLMTLPLPLAWRRLRRVAGSAGLGALVESGLALAAVRARRQ